MIMKCTMYSAEWWLLMTIIAGLLYIYSIWNYNYFLKRNIPFLRPVPLLGNMARSLFLKSHQIMNLNRAYFEFPNSRITGFFEFRTPTYIIRDPELIRQIGVKDFDYFLDHRSIVDVNNEPLFGNILFALKGQKWRDMRSTLSPAFTSSKMKQMYTLISDCAKQMSSHLLNESESGAMVMDMKDLFTRYTNDVIATCAFGIKVDSLGQPENEFYKMGKILTDFSSPKATLKFLGFGLVPELMKALGVKLLNNEVSTFFRNLILDTMKIREKKGIIRPDMINLLMEARKGTLTHEDQPDNQDAGFATVLESSEGRKTHKRAWTDDDLVAQAIVFFLAGFDTTATLLCFAAHELAVNPDIQNKLFDEIDALKRDGTPTYECIQKMKYLDMVISETLRKWPPGAVMDRYCLKPYTITDSKGKPELVIEEGKTVLFPAFAIHHDAQYYPDPERFDPERFSEENRRKIKPFTFIPFGVGPRNCIGSRFALMEIKTILFHILSDFTFKVCTKTSVPLELTKRALVMKPTNGFWLELQPRQFENIIEN